MGIRNESDPFVSYGSKSSLFLTGGTGTWCSITSLEFFEQGLSAGRNIEGVLSLASRERADEHELYSLIVRPNLISDVGKLR